MRLYDVIWKIRFIEKIADKHGVTTDEVEEILFGKSHFRRAQKGHVRAKIYMLPTVKLLAGVI